MIVYIHTEVLAGLSSTFDEAIVGADEVRFSISSVYLQEYDVAAAS
jgi:hypothetical protein